MNCQTYRRELDEREAGAPTPGLAAHAAACAACRRFSDERARLRQLVSELEPVGAPPDFEFRLKARLASEKPRGRGPWLPARFAPGAAAVALAALFALGVGLALRRQTSDAQNDLAREGVSASDEDRRARAVALSSNDAPTRVGPTQARAGGASDELAGRQADGRTNDPRAGRDVRRTRVTALASRREPKPAWRDAQARAGRATAAAPALETSESAFAAAQSFAVGEPIPVPVNPSAEPVRVVLLDERGASRVVAVKPVSFGAEVFAAQSDGPRRASRAAKEGVW